MKRFILVSMCILLFPLPVYPLELVTLTPSDEDLADYLGIPLSATASGRRRSLVPSIGAFGRPNIEDFLKKWPHYETRRHVHILAGEGVPLSVIYDLKALGFSIWDIHRKDLQTMWHDVKTLMMLWHVSQSTIKPIESFRGRSRSPVLVIVNFDPLMILCHNRPLSYALEWAGYQVACPFSYEGYRFIQPEFLRFLKPGTLILTPYALPPILQQLLPKDVLVIPLKADLLFRANYVNIQKVLSHIEQYSQRPRLYLAMDRHLGFTYCFHWLWNILGL